MIDSYKFSLIFPVIWPLDIYVTFKTPFLQEIRNAKIHWKNDLNSKSMAYCHPQNINHHLPVISFKFGTTKEFHLALHQLNIDRSIHVVGLFFCQWNWVGLFLQLSNLLLKCLHKVHHDWNIKTHNIVLVCFTYFQVGLSKYPHVFLIKKNEKQFIRLIRITWSSVAM